MHAPFPFIRTASEADLAKLTSPSTQMTVALGAVKRPGEVYGGTVGGVEKTRRRAQGKRRRAARKLHRGNR